MTTSQMLTAVEAKIKEAVPEIMQLKFGCKIKERGSIYIDKYIDTDADKETGEDVFCTWYYPDGHMADWEILGREIGLEDVLRAIGTDYGIYADGTFLSHEEGAPGLFNDMSNARWILGKDLTWHAEHAPETIQFLHDILCRI